jgi:hypothetical protein
MATKLSLIERQTGQKPTTQELLAALGTVGAECQNAHGSVGEMPESLRGLTDGVWLRNMVNLVDEHIRRVPLVANVDPSETQFAMNSATDSSVA